MYILMENLRETMICSTNICNISRADHCLMENLTEVFSSYIQEIQ